MTAAQDTTTRLIVQVAPHGSGGVTDYAEGLREAWAQTGVASSLLHLGAADVRSLPLERRLAGPAGGLAQVVVLLHVSGYGYAQRGLCFWLVRELRRAREALGPRLRLVTMFHELVASGPPWRSAFWTRGAQAGIAASLARMSDTVATNTLLHAAWLQARVPAGVQVGVRPVFSNVGESDGRCLLAPRLRRLVVFGSAPTRQRAFDALARVPRAALEALQVDEIVEAGDGGASRRPAGLQLPCRVLGRLPAADLGELLCGARYGLLEYGGPWLAKSGVFAAYAAHGCTPVNVAQETTSADGLAADWHYLSLRAGPPAAATDAARVGRAAWTWYQAHRRSVHGSELLQLCTSATSTPGPAPARRTDSDANGLEAGSR